jgi:hypothetical protein
MALAEAVQLPGQVRSQVQLGNEENEEKIPQQLPLFDHCCPLRDSNIVSSFGPPETDRVFLLWHSAVVDFHHADAGAIVHPSEKSGVSARRERRRYSRLEAVCGRQAGGI